MSLPHVTTKILSGLALRDVLLVQVAKAVRAMPQKPRLAIVQVGDNPASEAYVRNKLKACATVGIDGEHVRLREEEGEHQLLNVVRGLGHDPEVHAVIVQTPLPRGWHVQAALDAVPAAKDVDGLSSANIALRRAGDAAAVLPATPLGILRILQHLEIELNGTKVAVIGKGMVVGAPLREILTAAGAEVLPIDRSTPHPARLCHEAEVVVTACGVPGLVGREWVREGAVVIDVGITRHHGMLLGDVARLEVEGVAKVLTPVPGGVGPMTVASLLTNVVDCARREMGLDAVDWSV